jgi:hypothetical protein
MDAAVPALAAPVVTGGEGTAGPKGPVVRIADPAAVVNLVPYVLRFRPGDRDLVVIGVAPPQGRVKLTFRYDLPDEPGPLFTGLARRAAARLAEEGCAHVLIAGFGPDRLVTPAVAVAQEAAEAAGLVVTEALRAEGGRCWSYLCQRAPCCPPEGIECGPAGSPVAAALQAAGIPAPLASRSVLAAALAPPGDAEAGPMRQAMTRARTRADRLARRAGDPGRKPPRSPMEIAGGRAVLAAIRAYQADGSITGHDQAAWLLRVLAEDQARDMAWALTVPGQREAHLRLWTDLTRLAPDEYAAAPACLLALAAWQDGNGILASLALDRALAASPGYYLARFLRAALDSGAPPERAGDPAAVMRVARQLAREHGLGLAAG